MNWVSIGLSNGLSPNRRQAITWTNAGSIVNWTMRNKLKWNSNQNIKLFIHGNAFKNVVCEMVAILSRGRWVNPIAIRNAPKLHQILVSTVAAEALTLSTRTSAPTMLTQHLDGLVQERRNSSAIAMELGLSYTNPSIYCTTSVWKEMVTLQVNTLEIKRKKANTHWI